MTVNTKKVTGRRALKFTSFDEILADLDRIGAGPVKTLGNWSAGQIYRHLAIVMNGSIDGLLVEFPLFHRLMARLLKKMVLKGPMPAGFPFSAANAKVLAPSATSAEEGQAELRAALTRLVREPQRVRHPLFGSLTKEEWDKIHLMHANLHLSFIVPG